MEAERDQVTGERSHQRDEEGQDSNSRIGAHILKAKYLNFAVMNWAEATRTKNDLASTIVLNVAVGRATGLLDIIEGLAGRPATGQWEPIALQILYIRYLQLLRRTPVHVELETKGKTVKEAQDLLEKGALKDMRSQVEDLLAGESEAPDTATLLVLEERLGNALNRMSSS